MVRKKVQGNGEPKREAEDYPYMKRGNGKTKRGNGKPCVGVSPLFG